MDLAAEELQFMSVFQILRESVRIPKQSSRTFSLITLTLIFPLSFAILAHTLFTHPLLRRLQYRSTPATASHDLGILLLLQFLYLLFLFLFSLLSTAAVVLSVASLYSSSKPPSSFSALLSSALPRAFPRLARTFLFVSLLMTFYNLLFLAALALTFAASIAASEDSSSSPLLPLAAVLLVVLYFVLHVYITAWWHLASVVSVLEPVCGWAAMRKSRELLRGKTGAAAVLVSGYLVVCGVISGAFGGVVVRGAGVGVVGRVVVGGVLVGVLVVVNLVGLLVQSVFYYVCKSYHHEVIDKSALYEHLGGYLGEYVPLKSSVQMQSFDETL